MPDYTSGVIVLEKEGRMFKVQRKACSTCIYGKDSSLAIGELEKQIADPKFSGFFQSYRICHHSNDACCRGFWDRHKDKFALGQIAQRLGFVEFVNEDIHTSAGKLP